MRRQSGKRKFQVSLLSKTVPSTALNVSRASNNILKREIYRRFWVGPYEFIQVLSDPSVFDAGDFLFERVL